MKAAAKLLIFLTWPLVALCAGMVFAAILMFLWVFAIYGAFVGERDAWRLLFPWN